MTTTTSREMRLKFAIRRNGEVVERRRVSVLEPVFSVLEGIVKQWVYGRFSLKYTDDEGDLVTMGSQTEWEECVTLCEQQFNNSNNNNNDNDNTPKTSTISHPLTIIVDLAAVNVSSTLKQKLCEMDVQSRHEELRRLMMCRMWNRCHPHSCGVWREQEQETEREDEVKRPLGETNETLELVGTDHHNNINMKCEKNGKKNGKGKEKQEKKCQKQKRGASIEPEAQEVKDSSDDKETDDNNDTTNVKCEKKGKKNGKGKEKQEKEKKEKKCQKQKRGDSVEPISDDKETDNKAAKCDKKGKKCEKQKRGDSAEPISADGSKPEDQQDTNNDEENAKNEKKCGKKGKGNEKQDKKCQKQKGGDPVERISPVVVEETNESQIQQDSNVTIMTNDNNNNTTTATTTNTQMTEKENTWCSLGFDLTDEVREELKTKTLQQVIEQHLN